MRDVAGEGRQRAVIGVDVGASTTAGGLVTAHGEVLASAQVPTRGRGSVSEALLSLIGRLQDEAGARRVELLGVGVGIPGLVDVARGMIVAERHLLPELTRLPLAEMIQRRTGLPACVDNDVNALALGEARYGAGRGARSLVVLAVGTGVGGALIVEGTLVRGRHGYAGEFGHMTVALGGPPCMVGIHGCVCRFLCGETIEIEAQQRVRERPDSKILALAGGDPSAVTTRMVFEAAEAGDAVARAMVDTTCEALAACLGAVLNGLDPDVTVVTGGVVKSLVALEDDIRRRLAGYVLADVLAGSTIHVSPSDKSSTMRGAAALFLYESERRASPPSLAHVEEP